MIKSNKENYTVKDLIYKSIFSDILSGVYSMDQILTETMLIEKYSKSRSPVREALQELTREGVLKSIVRTGYTIVPIFPREIKEALELRKLVELHCLDIIFQNFNTDILKQLKAHQVKIQPILDTQEIADHWLANIDFHVTLASFANNSYFCRTLYGTMLFCSRGVAQYFHKSWEKKKSNRDVHDALIEALEKQDKEEAKSLLCTDIDSIMSSII